ncbi:hypothetical protein S40293_09824 [Stachybotrys chartarum IBT 40293]|nr:hypothetical protein S40293_09824 [Stachybotrys chartarum IBT 40293]
MACFTTSPRDPIFWQYHSIFNEVQEAWHSLQPANVALVIDRSGSMASTIPSEGTTRLQAAKDAAQMFADMVDVTSEHRLGLVSFSNAATTNLALTSASSFSSALNTALGSVTANGLTSIGAGLNAAQAMVNGGSQPRKGIVLLTDGRENVAPMINSVNLGDTHLCAVGFGSPNNLDGDKLRDLAELQGGIWTSTQVTTELKKIFVQCFSNIFDTQQALDPVDSLPVSSLVSAPTIHGSLGDDTAVFVLGWANSTAQLLLSITTPLGSIVNLDAPNVQSRVGRTWHVVRIKLPYQGERDGDWTARAVLQPTRGYVNGFSSLAVADWTAGTQLVRSQLATLCANGCRSVLFYQDMTNDTIFSHDGATGIYHEAVFSQSSRGNIGNTTVASSPADFATLLGRGGWDLIVYNAPLPSTAQVYDQALSQLLCGGRIKFVISDTRSTTSADAILRCAGVTRGAFTTTTELVYLTPTTSELIPSLFQFKEAPVRGIRSYALTGGSVHANYAGGFRGAASIGVGGSGSGTIAYFISVLAKSSVRLKPYPYLSNITVGQDFHPSFYIPIPYRPECGFNQVDANVTITRPLMSLAAIRAEFGDGQDEDAPSVRIPTETNTFPLYDDGTNGDRVRGDYHFETALSNFTQFDGEYKLHARIRLCNRRPCGRLSCIVREAEHVLDVRPR